MPEDEQARKRLRVLEKFRKKQVLGLVSPATGLQMSTWACQSCYGVIAMGDGCFEVLN